MRIILAFSALLLAGSAVGSAPGEPADVVVPLGNGVRVNWTRMVLEAERTGEGAGVGSTRRALEQQVRTEIGPAILDGAWRVLVTADDRVEDLVESEDVGPKIRSRLARWAVSETRYYTSGRVALVGQLSLQDLLKPWTLAAAVPDVEATAAAGGRRPMVLAVAAFVDAPARAEVVDLDAGFPLGFVGEVAAEELHRELVFS